MKAVRAALLTALLLGTLAAALRVGAPAAADHLGPPAVADTPPTFTKKPTATRSGDKVKIEFTADRKTDLAVTVEDAKGATVRRLGPLGLRGRHHQPPRRAGEARLHGGGGVRRAVGAPA